MKRQIIRINENLCNGCGNCIPNCPEGALQLIDGKARLVCDLFCDGLGACIGECPVGAIEIEEREAEPYDEKRVMENIVKQGGNTIKAHLSHLKDHNQEKFYQEAVEFLKERNIEIPKDAHESGCGCPGGMMMDFRDEKKCEESHETPASPVKSELRHWPVQLQLLNPEAPYFDEADLAITADCVPFTMADFHQRLLRGKILIVFCPKLDQTIDQYIEKLSSIFAKKRIKSISVIHMEVPCCYGTVKILERAMEKAGVQIPVHDYTISIKGEIIEK